MQEYDSKEAEHWDRLIGLIWATMLCDFKLNPLGTILEIGPGFTLKIAYGLAGIDFSGTVILLEPNISAGAWTMEKYRTILPKAEIIHLPQPILHAKIPNKQTIDLLVANHILDDLLLHAYLSPELSETVFERMRPNSSCSEVFINSWCELIKEKKVLEGHAAHVVAEFSGLIEKIQPRLLLLSQYPSWKHSIHNLNIIHIQALHVMQKLETTIGAICIETLDSPLANYQWPIRWLIKDYSAMNNQL